MSITTSKTAPKKTKAKETEQELLLVGLDLGTNTTCVQVAKPTTGKVVASELIPSIVGYTTEGILPGIIPGDATALYGQLALKYKLHLNLIQPLRDGIIADMDAARDFLVHLKETAGISPDAEVRAVIGMPANADSEALENTRLAVTGIFDKVILIPEPFLAALGSRDDSQLVKADYVDPVCNSLFVDIGAGSTDVCLIQGYYPSAEDQISFAFAGDAVDEAIQASLLNKYPDSQISIAKCREIKEKHSFVQGATQHATHPVMISGKIKQLEVSDAVGTACDTLLKKIYDAVRNLIIKADPDSIPDLLQNIIITGGGSMIKGLDAALQKLLTEEGFEGCKVTSVGEDYKVRVATGAITAAFQAKERQWQTLLR
ncbi:rod shape-determining protein [Pelagicoccus sp. NFK12]|uniref:Rod shape-determining protein n=1 Tax=Pelagicoccus enzymogenes TaxID=2773457 RepID=A0A927F5W5_9BACT|nr:rod shape-determining protein [Pelagicoccus enzymogenes]MBD5778444.1 rod shape-determining protein [Pelagicoccus enzymogenes]MDQ8197195.1 rod shape-determining protein [Pelagicoccus enzymogenes]